jgi:branched-chain amino acid aminotransferase
MSRGASANGGPAPNSREAPFASARHTPSEDRPLIWIDGEIVPRSRAKISVYDHGVLYGDGVFEGLRVYGGRVFKMRTHLERLMASAEAIRLRVPQTIEELERIIRETLAANELRDGYVRLVVTRGAGTLGLDPTKCPTPSVFCIADAIRLYPEEMYRDGMRIVVARRPRVPTRCLDPKIKSCNYLNNILAKLEAIDAGLLEAVMLNEREEVAECTGDNIFMVRGGEVLTPPEEAGILMGVTRGFVMGLCKKLDVKCREETLFVSDLHTADEVFLTGTAAEVIAVSAIDDTRIGDGKEGPITRRIRELFHEVTAREAPED